MNVEEDRRVMTDLQRHPIPELALEEQVMRST
jgi:hypothetical protein